MRVSKTQILGESISDLIILGLTRNLVTTAVQWRSEQGERRLIVEPKNILILSLSDDQCPCYITHRTKYHYLPHWCIQISQMRRCYKSYDVEFDEEIDQLRKRSQIM